MRKFISIICLLSTLASAEPEKSHFRNIIILLDQEGTYENIGRPGRIFLTNKLQAALNEQAAPIIINAALWNAFIEKRLSIQQMAEVPDSPEKKALEMYNNVGERLTYWIDHYRKQNIEPMQAKQLGLEKVNEEFYQKEINEDNKSVTHEASVALAAYLTHFDKNEWEVYTNGKSFYLLSPKKNLEKLQKNETKRANNTSFSEKELLLGLKVDHLSPVADIEDPVTGYFDGSEHKKSLSLVLHDFFITKHDINSQELPYKWNIILSGHGGSYYKEITTDKTTPEAKAIIADLTVDEFHSVLEFCEHSISTNSFHYSTCYGAGNHIKMAFDDYGNPAYNYSIICGCISDGYAHCLWRHLSFPTGDNKTLLQPTDIACESNEKWRMKIDHKYEWKKFFKTLEKNSFEKADLNWLLKALPSITYDKLCDNPVIRLPKSTSFVPVLSDGLITLNTTLLTLKQMENAENITIPQDTVLVEAPVISLPVTIKSPAHIVSIAPGNAQHYFEKIEFKSAKNFLETFIPVEGGSWYDKHFIIQELTVKNDKNSTLSKKLGLETEYINAKNVLVNTQKDTLVRIFAQIENNFYMITIVRTDYLKGKAEIKGITKMSKHSSEIYLKKYQQLKDQILKDSPQNSTKIS